MCVCARYTLVMSLVCVCMSFKAWHVKGMLCVTGVAGGQGMLPELLALTHRTPLSQPVLSFLVSPTESLVVAVS